MFKHACIKNDIHILLLQISFEIFLFPFNLLPAHFEYGNNKKKSESDQIRKNIKGSTEAVRSSQTIN
jgi:hypothetical protein